MRRAISGWMTVLCALAAMLGPVRSSCAQWDGYEPQFSSAQLEDALKSLELDLEQRDIARSLHEGYMSDHTRAVEQMKAYMEEIQRIAEATQNPIFIMVMDAMRRMRGQEAWERLKRASFGPATRDRYRAEHRAVLQALEQRDQRAAAAAMFAHLRSVRATIFSDGLWGREASAKEGPTP